MRGVIWGAAFACLAVLGVRWESVAGTIAPIVIFGGSVTDGAQHPIAGALVRLDGAPVETTAYTDAHGRFIMGAPPGHYALRVSAAGFASREVPVAVTTTPRQYGVQLQRAGGAFDPETASVPAFAPGTDAAWWNQPERTLHDRLLAVAPEPHAHLLFDGSLLPGVSSRLIDPRDLPSAPFGGLRALRSPVDSPGALTAPAYDLTPLLANPQDGNESGFAAYAGGNGVLAQSLSGQVAARIVAGGSLADEDLSRGGGRYVAASAESTVGGLAVAVHSLRYGSSALERGLHLDAASLAGSFGDLHAAVHFAEGKAYDALDTEYTRQIDARIDRQVGSAELSAAVLSDSVTFDGTRSAEHRLALGTRFPTNGGVLSFEDVRVADAYGSGWYPRASFETSDGPTRSRIAWWRSYAAPERGNGVELDVERLMGATWIYARGFRQRAVTGAAAMRDDGVEFGIYQSNRIFKSALEGGLAFDMGSQTRFLPAIVISGAHTRFAWDATEVRYEFAVGRTTLSIARQASDGLRPARLVFGARF